MIKLKRPVRETLFPARLWTAGFTYWWIVALINVLLFDIFWMIQTTFRPFTFFAFWPVLFLSSFVLALPSLFERKGIIQIIWLLFFDLLFIANLMYCRTYFNAIPLQSYGLAGNLADFTSSVTESFKWYFLFLPLVSVAAFVIYSLHYKISKKLPSPLLYLTYVVALFVITWASDAIRGGTYKKMEYMSEYSVLANCVTPVYSLAGFLYYDHVRGKEILSEGERKHIDDWLATHTEIVSPYWNDSIRDGRKVPKNLVVVLVESLESWPLEKKIDNKEITPFLNTLLQDSATFYAPNVVTQVGPGRSIDGQMMVMTGMLPMFNKVFAYSTVGNYFFSLPKAYKEARGGKTYLFTCDKPYTWNQAPISIAFGIDSLIHNGKLVRDETIGGKRITDASLMRQIAEKLNKGDIWPEGSPGMVVAVTNSSHHPFELPQQFRHLDFDNKYPEIVKNYMTAVNYTDSSLTSLINYLKGRKDWEETMVVITGDHEGLTVDRRQAIADPLSRTFVDSMQHTPLIILNSPVKGRYYGEMGQDDIYSTILDLMDFKDYEWKGMGISIFDPRHPGVAVGSAGDVVGNTSNIDPSLIEHLKQAERVSDRIMKFNLLNPSTTVSGGL